MMRHVLLTVLLAALAATCPAQNRVFVQKDSVYIASPDGSAVRVTSGEIKTKLDEYKPQIQATDDLLAAYRRIAELQEQAARLRAEQDVFSRLLLDVSGKEAEIEKQKQVAQTGPQAKKK